MKISEMITDRYKLRIPPTVYYDLLADVQEVEEVQEPRKGHWIKHENPSLGICMQVSYECSCCGVYQGCENFIRKSFCPNCGADMRADRSV